jgi:branched-chain amino acid transport system permease protein
VTPGRLVALGALALLALFPVPFGNFGYFVGAYAVVYAMIGLSIVVVTGYAGLISLMPYALAGVGAMATGLAMASWGWPFWLAVPLAALSTIPIALLVGVASVRLQGLYLAIATLTGASVLGETFFRWDDVTGGSAGWIVTRPTVGPVDFASDLSFYVLCLLSVLVLLFMVEGLRTSRLGRAMVAVRDNEIEAQALGINVYKTKIVTLLLGGMLAGVGGAFLAALLVNATPTPFRSPFTEITSFLLVSTVAIGGIGRAVGAFIGAIVLVVQQQVFGGAEFFYAFVTMYTALVLILLLRFRPGGLIQIGQRQIELIKKRPVFGSLVALGVLGVNVGLAYLFVRLS